MTDPTTTDERYPDVPIDALGFDAIVRQLSEMDEDHRTKAVGLVMCAVTEFNYARADGDVPDVDFEEFVDVLLEQWNDIEQ